MTLVDTIFVLIILGVSNRLAVFSIKIQKKSHYPNSLY